MAENTTKPTPIPLDLWIAEQPSRAVAAAGMTHAKPDLVGAEKTPEQWQKALDTYNATPIDPKPVDETEAS